MTRRSTFRRSVVFAILFAIPLLCAQETSSWEENFTRGSQAIRDGRYADAHRFMLGALEQSAAFPPNDIRRGQTDHVLGSVYQMQGNMRHAESLYLEARAIFEVNGAAGKKYLASTLDILGQLLFEEGRWGESEELLKQSLALYGELDGENDPHTMIPARHLGELYSTTGRHPQALVLLERAVKVFRQSGLTAGLAATLVSLGHLHLLEGRNDASEAALREAVRLNATLGDQHPALADSLVNLAVLYRVKGQSDRAEPLLRKAAGIYRAAGDPHLAGPLSELGHIALAARKYATAEKNFQESLDIVTKTFGPKHVTAALVLLPMSEACLGEHDYAKADALIRQALPRLRRFYSDASFEVAKALLIAAQIEEKQNRQSEAYSDYREAVAVYGRSIGPKHPEAIYAQELYSRFVKKLGR